LAIVAHGLFAGMAAACPTCKNAIAEGGNAAGLVNGYGWSIVFMMSMPFLIFIGVSGYFYYEVCRARRLQGASRSY